MNDKIEHRQKAYNLGSTLLSLIAHHQHQADVGTLGYFFSPENIIEKNGLKYSYATLSLSAYFRNRDCDFDALDEEDKIKLDKLISEVQLSLSTKSLRGTCAKCSLLSNAFDQKIMAAKA
ncbi:MAG: hypothetical protein V4504_01175 [Patescibacteria group bacterium]